MAKAPPQFPPLSHAKVKNALLFGDRLEMLTGLNVPLGARIAEVGILRGDLSEFLIKKFNPTSFVGFDTFQCHNFPMIWGIPSSEFFSGITQIEYCRKRLVPLSDRVVLEEGVSWDLMAKYPPNSFDLIYIDAGHDYDSVLRDARAAIRLLAKGGIIFFNDYIMFDHFAGEYYGIVPVVNEMVENGGWRVAGFAFQQNMFCDIALKRD